MPEEYYHVLRILVCNEYTRSHSELNNSNTYNVLLLKLCNDDYTVVIACGTNYKLWRFAPFHNAILTTNQPHNTV